MSFGSLPNHKYVLAKESGHKVWEDNPQLVINEIIKLYKEVNYIKSKSRTANIGYNNCLFSPTENYAEISVWRVLARLSANPRNA